jgi:ribosomal protein S18 acetylase RimI-like enzyme
MDEPASRIERSASHGSPSHRRGRSPGADSRVRTAGPEDAAALARVAAATFPLACPPHTTPKAIADFIAANLTEARFAEYLRDPARQLLLLEVGGEGGVDAAAAGYAMVVHAVPSDADVVAAIGSAPTTELSKLYLLPGHHGSGLANGLMDAAIALAVAHGSSTIWLGVNQLNERANRFYGKHGFQIAGPKRFLVGDRFEDDWVRVRRLAG